MAGFLARLAGGLLRDRTLQAGTGISISNPAGEAGDPTITCTVSPGTGTVTHTGSLTANDLVLGNGTADITSLGAAGTTNQVLHGNAAGAPSFSAVDLAADVSGDLPLANLAQGTALSVLGVAGNATADEASIVAGSDGNVLRRSGTSVGFGAIALGSSNAVSGTLADANLSANVALVNIDNHLVAQTFATGSVVTTAANPLFYFNETGNAANQHFWRIGEESSNFYLQPLDDGLALQASFIIDRLANINAFGGQINFPATQSASAGANTLDDYEEGSWTPTDASGAGLTLTGGGNNAYVKIGKFVYITGTFVYPVTASGLAAVVGGLPFTVKTTQPGGGGSYVFTTTSRNDLIFCRENTTHIEIFNNAAGTITNAQMSGTSNIITACYIATA